MAGTDSCAGTILGRYRLTGRLGQGGFGVVYAAYDDQLHRPVALKLLSENAAREREFLGRFLLEARAAARLSHPNVVPVFDIGQHRGETYIVMEMMSGGSLQAQLAARGAYPWPDATRLIVDVCRGLAAAHAAGITHRDVKPANILLAADGTAKLADFGFTKAPELAPGKFTRLGTRIGTPQYMSPEQCSGELLDERTDLYSLGASYYALLTGKPPFDGADPALILFAHCSAPIPDPRDRVPELPESCAHVLQRALAKSRPDRYRSANEMLQDLLGVGRSKIQVTTAAATFTQVDLSSTPSPAPVEMPVTEAAHRVDRRLLLGAGAAVISLVVVSLLLLLMALGNRSLAPGKVVEPAINGAVAGGALAFKPRAPLTGHQGDVTAIQLAAGRIVSAGADGTARFWSLDGSDDVRIMHHPGGLGAVSVSPDGKLVAAGGNLKAIFFWDSAGKGLGAIPANFGNTRALAFHPSAPQIAIASEGDLALCNYTPSGKVTGRTVLFRPEYLVPAMAFARDGKRLVACDGNGNVSLWELPSRKQTLAPGKLRDDLKAIAISDDGRRVAVGTHNGIVYLWEPDGELPPKVLLGGAGKITSLAFAPGHNTLVLAGEWGGPLRVCDLASGTTRAVRTGVTVVNAIAFAPDGRTLAAACSDGTVRLWDVTPAATVK